MAGAPLAGQVVLVTGGRQGVGLAIAERLRAEGATVVTTSRSGEPPRLDVCREESVLQLFEWMDRTHGRLDVLVNNAGVGIFKPLTELTLEEWREVLETNLTGAFLCAREAFKRMKAHGGGRILNIGSVAGQVGLPGMGAYGASKYGLRGLTEVLTQEGVGCNVQACLLTLGAVRAGMSSGLPGVSAEDMLAAEDVAQLVVDVLRLPLRARVDEVRLLPPRGIL